MTESDKERQRRIAEILGEWVEPEISPDLVLDDGYQYVMGLDPGGTTGVAMLRYTDDTPVELVYLHQIADGLEGFYDFFKGSRVGSNLTIVSEKWVERNIKGADRTPLVIEGAQYAMWQDEVVYQDPKMKSLVPDEYLKEQNLWTEGKRHQMDALIHALVYLRNNDHQPTMKSMSGSSSDDAQPIAEPGEAEDKQLSEDSGTGSEAFAELAEAGPEETGSSIDSLLDSEIDYSGINNEVNGTRKKREISGVFAGYETDTDGQERTLLDD